MKPRKPTEGEKILAAGWREASDGWGEALSALKWAQIGWLITLVLFIIYVLVGK